MSIPLQHIGILGAGQMGAAAAVMFRRAGFHVSLWTRSEAGLNAAQPAMEAVDRFLDHHFGTSPTQTGSVSLERNLEKVDTNSDAVLECVVEDMGEKCALLSKLQSCRKRDALIMSCTSALSITDMASGSGMEPVLVGAHFWNPPHLIPVVEIVAGKLTPAHQADRAYALMEKLGKQPVRCTDVPGFVGNRLMHAMWREALSLVDAGVCTAEDIDRVVKGTFALRLPALGPMENMDLVGLALVERVERYLLPHLATNAAPAKALTQRLKDGQGGMKDGHGFYDWTQRDAAKLVALRDTQIVRQLRFLSSEGT